MKALVTGSDGLIGRSCVDLFARKGWEVVGCDNGKRGEWFLGGDSAGNGVLSIDDVSGYDAIIHCAGQPSHDFASDRPDEDFEANVLTTRHLLKLAKEQNKHCPFVFCSTNKVYGDQPNKLSQGHYDEKTPIDQCMHSIFGAHKLAADVLVQEYGRYYGMPTACFRLGCVTGENHKGVKAHGFLSYLAKVKEEGGTYEVIGYEGEQVRDNIHADDVARAFWCYVQRPKPGEVYNLGGGSRWARKLNDILDANDIKRTYNPEARLGDHREYITDFSKFLFDYPEWTGPVINPYERMGLK